MSVRAMNTARPMGYDTEGAIPGQQAQNFSSSSYNSSPAPYIQQMQAQQPRASMPIQQRPLSIEHQQQVLARSAQSAMGMARQNSPAFLQAQALRQRQAAVAANWAMQQEQKNLQISTQRLGSAILRLLNFSEQMNSFSDSSDLSAWKQFVDTFFIDPALCTVSLPIDPSLSYELPTPLLPHYYYRLHKEIAKMALTFHDAKEYYIAPASHVVVCPLATLCYYFPNDTKVEMLGRLKVVFSPSSPNNAALKIENMEFVGQTWEEWVCRQPPQPNRIARGETSVASAPDKKKESKRDQDADTEKGPPEELQGAPQEGSRKSNDDEDEDDDLEDLFGRSPSASVPAPSRPESRADDNPQLPKKQDSPNVENDLTNRKRMVMQSGVTPAHKRLLEISDVLGQLSPLFGKKNPRTALDELLASLPPLPEEDKRRQQPLGDANAARTCQPDSGQGGGVSESVQSSDIAQHVSGRVMQQQAAQLLQKQAAQTLSLALPPANFEFSESREPDAEEDNDDDAMHEAEDPFMPLELGSGDTERNGTKEDQVEPKMEPDADGANDLDLDLDALGERDSDFEGALEFGIEPSQSNSSSMTGASSVVIVKRDGEDVFGRGKRVKKSEEE